MRAMSDLRIRAARLPEEAESLGATDWRAFREGTPEGWADYYRDNEHLRHADGVLVAEDAGGVVAGQCALLRFSMALAGGDVPLVGIAAVGVQPEARRRGVADRLMRETLRRIRRAGVPYAALYPFAASYYRRFGYETVEQAEVLRVPPRHLPTSPLAARCRRANLERDLPAMEALYERWRAGRTGPIQRGRFWWDARVARRSREWLLFEEDGALAGYLGWDAPDRLAYPRQEIVVRELVAATPAARQALVGFLAAQGEQFRRVELACAPGEGWPMLAEQALVDTDGPLHASQVVVAGGGMMARIVDVPAALAAHPAPKRHGLKARVGLDLIDPVFPDQTRGFDVSFGPHGAHAEAGAHVRPRLRVTVQRLAQILFAAVPARRLLGLALVEGDAEAAAVLDDASAGPAPFLGTANFF
jgi:predicted acetyltransferase